MKMMTYNGVSRQRKRWIVLLFAWVLLFCVPGLAGAADISGTIKNEAGWGLGNVTVTLVSTSGTSYYAVTGWWGNYTITGIPDGRYKVTPSPSGYTFNPDSVSISIDEGSIVMDFPAGPDKHNLANFDAFSVDFVGGTYSCSIPAFDDYTKAFWTDPAIQQDSNCYNYALNVLDDASIGGNATPGIAGGYDLREAMEAYGADTCRSYTEGAITDGLEYIGMGTSCPNGKTLVALFTSWEGGFHWFRRDSNEKWSNKNGTEAPRKGIDRRTWLWATDLENLIHWRYPNHCANFCVCSSSLNGQGHETIANAVWD